MVISSDTSELYGCRALKMSKEEIFQMLSLKIIIILGNCLTTFVQNNYYFRQLSAFYNLLQISAQSIR